MPLDFSGRNLRGRNFKGQDLTGANFSYADIRGTNFANAVLQGSNFTRAKAGLQKHWILNLIAISLILAVASGLILLFAAQGIIGAGLSPKSGLFITLILVVVGAFCAFTVYRNFETALLVVATILIGLVAIAVMAFASLSIANSFFNLKGGVRFGLSLIGLIGSMSWYLLAALLGVLITAITLALAIETSRVMAIAQLLILATILPWAVEKEAVNLMGVFQSINPPPFWRIFATELLTVLMVLTSSYVGWRAASGDNRFGFIQKIAIAFAAIGGTSFRNANLTDANFTQAKLKSTDLRNAILSRTCWSHVQNLDRARVDSTYLQHSQIRQLVVTLQGQGQKCDRLNLAGINLKGANLQDASFIGADLNDADLQNANLSRAVLKQTQLDGADLTGACLTGAYIEDWGITGETKLDGVQCEYVYMHVPTKEDPDPLRKPDNRNEVFEDGDFADFIKPIVDTLDLYHNQGVDPRAIAIAFKNLAEDNPAADLEIVAMEKRGKGKFLLRAKTAPGTNKSELSQAYFDDYNQLKTLPTNHLKLLLAEKDDRIRSLESMVKTAINQPKFHADNYHHRGDVMPENSGININAGRDIGDISGLVGGDVSGVVNLGEISGQVTNTINQLPASPQPDEPGIKELLEQLQRAIESAEELKPEDKAEALKQVQALAEAGKDPAEAEKQNMAKSAIRWFKGMLTELAEPSAIVQLCKKILPHIATIFGL